MTLDALLVGTLVFAVTVIGTPIAGRIAGRVGAVSKPRGDRWGGRTIPTLGGIAIVAGILTGVAVTGPLDAVRAAIAFGVGVLLLVGVVDDLHQVHPAARLAVQGVLGAGLGWQMAADLEALPSVLLIFAGAAAVPVIVNATNLIDNADGLSSALTAASAAGLAVGATILGMSTDPVVMGIIVTAACLGFLVHNRPPARIFMGDAGSLPLGFALSAIIFLLVREAADAGPAPVAIALLVVGSAIAVQLGDLAMVVMTRWRRGTSPFRGGVDHTSHRLVRWGLGSGAMVFSLTLSSVILQSIALSAAWARPDIVAAIGVGALIVVIVLAFETVVVRTTAATNEPSKVV